MNPQETAGDGGRGRRDRRWGRGFLLLALLATVSGALILGLAWLRPREYFPPGDTRLAERLDEYMRQVLASRPAPGIAVGVLRGDELVFSKGYGTEHLEQGGAVGPETIFHTASVSKTFVALGIMQLVDQGRLDLDTPVTRVLPDFRLADASAPEITFRQLLGHMSGLPSDVGGRGWWENPEDDPSALERNVMSLATVAPEAAPGEKWGYSNIGYEILGHVIARVSGMTFEEYMDVNVLQPLGMTRSTFLGVTGPAAGIAWSHRGNLMPVVNDFYPYHRAHAPSSTLKSNVPDLGRWLAMHLHRGQAGATRVLSAASLEGMWEPQARLERDELRMALGWFVGSHRGSRMLFHPGRDPGFNTFIGFLPDRGVGVVVLSNYDGQSAMEMVEIAHGLLDIGQGRSSEPPRASILIPLAAAMRQGGVPAVIEEFGKLRGDPRYSYTSSDLSTLGHELRKQDRLDEAIELYALNATEHPDYFAPYLFLAQSYLGKGDAPRALEYYRQGLDCDPEGRWNFPLSEYRIERLETLMRETDR